MQANHADGLSVQIRQLIMHVAILKIGEKTRQKRITIKFRLFEFTYQAVNGLSIFRCGGAEFTGRHGVFPSGE
ncbi:hypothetical protein D3C80_1107670 [compost metagenome]